MLSFSKYQGTGNDFIMIDNRDKLFEKSKEEIAFLCDRRFGIGADGLILIESQPDFDFKMKYFNADGNEGSMCGNGSRCLTQFAFDQGIKKEKYSFIASDGDHESFIKENGWIHVKMIDVNNVKNYNEDFVLNTGSPHYVKQVVELDKLDVFNEGKLVRYNTEFKQNGINVNFVEKINNDTIKVRTYERGVEDETLSCGTGITASSLVCFYNDMGFNKINVQAPGGNLAVEFEKIGEHSFENIWLCGPATFVFKGEIKV